MRFLYSLVYICLCFLLLSGLTFASVASNHALGNPLLIIEDDATVSSVFNQGNPAGLALIPDQTRMDLSLITDYSLGRYKYNTFPRGVTSVALPHVSPDGATIVANSWFAQNQYLFHSSLNSEKDYEWSGIIFRPDAALTLQFVPFGTIQRNVYSEDFPASRLFNSGLKTRGAYQLNQNISLGLGLGYNAGQSDGWQSGLFKDFFVSPITNQEMFSEYLSAELGVNFRSQEVFEKNDIFDVGILFKSDHFKTYGKIFFAENAETFSANIDKTALPFSLGLLTSYSYKSLMDIAFQFGYEETKDYYNWSSANYGTIDPFVYSTMNNYFFDLSFRVRLPMIKDDDLRFGVAFTNKGLGNTYPAGRIEMDMPSQDNPVPDINTSSSSIAIETGIVPYEESLISIKYHLGSSRSVQSAASSNLSDILLENYGYTEVSLGTKFKILDWLFLSSSYTNHRQSTEDIEYTFSTSTTDPYTATTKPVIKSRETNTLRLGIGIKTKTWDLDLTTAAYRIAYSPTGWTYRPTNVEIDEEFNHGYYSILSFIYRY